MAKRNRDSIQAIDVFAGAFVLAIVLLFGSAIAWVWFEWEWLLKLMLTCVIVIVAFLVSLKLMDL